MRKIKLEIVYFDTENLNSIEQAEIKKTKLENEGFTLIETKQLPLNKWILIYQK